MHRVTIFFEIEFYKPFSGWVHPMLKMSQTTNIPDFNTTEYERQNVSDYECVRLRMSQTTNVSATNIDLKRMTQKYNSVKILTCIRHRCLVRVALGVVTIICVHHQDTIPHQLTLQDALGDASHPWRGRKLVISRHVYVPVAGRYRGPHAPEPVAVLWRSHGQKTCSHSYHIADTDRRDHTAGYQKILIIIIHFFCL